MSYIPDMTERFPEGMRGIDMTPSYFGEPVDYSQAYKENTKCEFEIGDTYQFTGMCGETKTYTIKDIDRENNRLIADIECEDEIVSGNRPSICCELSTDEDGSERALLFESDKYGEIWLYAKC